MPVPQAINNHAAHRTPKMGAEQRYANTAKMQTAQERRARNDFVQTLADQNCQAYTARQSIDSILVGGR